MVNAERGNLYLGYALIASVVILASALLVKVHRDFVLLFPVGVLIFFMPNLMELRVRWQLGRKFRQQISLICQDNPEQVTVLKNELGGIESQAVWIDRSRGRLGFISADKEMLSKGWESLSGVRAMFANETYAISFHKGHVRIPSRYFLIFEFASGDPFELVTMRLRQMRKWIEVLRSQGDVQIDTVDLDEKC